MVILDLRAVSFMDSTGVRMMIAADRQFRQRGASLVVVQGPPNLRRLFTLAGLDGHLKLVDQVADPDSN